MGTFIFFRNYTIRSPWANSTEQHGNVLKIWNVSFCCRVSKILRPKKLEDSFFFSALLPIPLFPFYFSTEGEESNKQKERGDEDKLFCTFIKNKQITETFNLKKGKKHSSSNKSEWQHKSQVSSILKGNHRGWKMPWEEQFFSFMLFFRTMTSECHWDRAQPSTLEL